MALAPAQELDMRDPGHIREYPVAAAAVIHKGAICMWHATTGDIIPGADTAGSYFAGIAIESVTGGATSGAKRVKVWTTGCFKLTGVSLALADVGHMVYIYDDAACTDDTGSTNVQGLGIMTEWLSATSAWVEINQPKCPGVASS
jgi:hypothetical protein